MSKQADSDEPVIKCPYTSIFHTANKLVQKHIAQQLYNFPADSNPLHILFLPGYNPHQFYMSQLQKKCTILFMLISHWLFIYDNIILIKRHLPEWQELFTQICA